jgi:transposase
MQLPREQETFGSGSKFVWPPIVEGALQLTAAQLALLIEGIDWRRTVAPQAPERLAFR